MTDLRYRMHFPARSPRAARSLSLGVAVAIGVAAAAAGMVGCARHVAGVAGPGAEPAAAAVRPVEREIWARPDGPLVVPVDIDGSLRPHAGLRVPVTLDDGTSLPATLWWIGTAPQEDEQWSLAPRDPREQPGAWGATSPAAQAAVWLGADRSRAAFKWTSRLASERVRTGAAGMYALVAQMPRGSAEAVRDGGGGGGWGGGGSHRIAIGDRVAALRWLPAWGGGAEAASAGGLVDPPPSDSIRQSPGLRASLQLCARSPLLRWRCRLAQGAGLFGGQNPGNDRFADAVIEALGAQIEARWAHALSRLAADDANLARRIARRLGSVVDFGAGVAMPVWSVQDDQSSQLLEALLRDDLVPGERARAARSWLDTQPGAVVWVVDDAGGRDILSGGVVTTLGVANLGEEGAACWGAGDSGGAGAGEAGGGAPVPEIVTIPARGAGRIIAIAPEGGADATSAHVRARHAREGQLFTVHAGGALASRRVFSRRLPVIPPGAQVGPLLTDFTVQTWLAQGQDVTAGGGPSPGASPVASMEPEWLTAGLLYRGSPGATASASPGGGAPGASRASSTSGPEGWMVYLEFARLRPDGPHAGPGRIGGGPAPVRPGEADQLGHLRLWFGPFGAPTAVLRINPDGTVIDQTGGATALAPAHVRTTQVGEGWACWVPVPAGAVEADGTLRLGVERTDARGVRSAWPRPMLPWQREPGRAALDASTWDRVPPNAAP